MQALCNKHLTKRTESHTIHISMQSIAIVGQGYVGLPLSLEFARNGLTVYAIDIDETKIEKLRQGISYFNHIEGESIMEAVNSGRLIPTTEFEHVKQVQAIILCLPTPLTEDFKPELKYVTKSLQQIAPYLQSGQLVCLESTTYPGTSEEVVAPLLEEVTQMKMGQDMFLAYSPERVDPGNQNYNLSQIPKLVGGINQRSRQLAAQLYRKAFEQVIEVSSCGVAEAAKLMENIFRSVNIALVNELKLVYNAMGINIWEVIEAAKTKPFGYMPFYPGPGLGGHCIPIDPYYLTWKAQQYGIKTRFIELAGEVNRGMPDNVVRVAIEALNREGKAVRNARILLLGLAYKENINDDRESPTYAVMDKLSKLHAKVAYHDPYIPQLPATRKHAHLAGIRSENLSNDWDMMIVMTAHRQFKEHDFKDYKGILIDTRNCISDKPADYIRA